MRTRSGGLALLSLLLAPAVLATAPAGEAASGASATVARFQQTLIATMKAGDTLDFHGRWRLLEPVVRATFDFDYITRLVVGTHWPDLDDARRQALKRGVVRYGLATLASQFNAWAGERFEVQSEHALRDGRRRVRSLFHEAGGDRVLVDYVVEENGGAWRILNVWFSGVSASRIHRQEYAAVIERQGVDALIDLLERKVELFATEG